MINQYEVPAYLVEELPGIEDDLKSISPTLNVVKSIQCLTNYTRRIVMQHDMHKVKRCFAVAEDIYAKGDALVRDAIENVFVFSFSSLLNLCSKDEKIQVQGLMPLYLHTAYVQKVLKHSI